MIPRPLLLGLLLATATARANLRAPTTGEGGFSGAMRIAATGGPVLVDEKMSIGFDTDAEGLARTASFSITYLIENRGEAIDLPVAFLGIAVEKPVITINGRDVDFDRRTDRRLQRELIERMVAQRCAFRPALGRFDDLRLDLLSHLGAPGERLDCEHPDHLRERIDKADLKQLGVYDKLDTVAFVAHLAPGKNRVVVGYKQPLFVAEGPYESSAFGIHGAALGFDYLLYPARTWTIDPKFHLQIDIALPHPRIHGRLRDTVVAPQWQSNLALTDGSPKSVELTYLKGSFSGVPADIFSFVFSVK